MLVGDIVLSLASSTEKNVLFLPSANGMRERWSLLWCTGLGVFVDEAIQGCRSIQGILEQAGRWTGSHFTERSCVRVLSTPCSQGQLQKVPLLLVSLPQPDLQQLCSVSISRYCALSSSCPPGAVRLLTHLQGCQLPDHCPVCSHRPGP